MTAGAVSMDIPDSAAALGWAGTASVIVGLIYKAWRDKHKTTTEVKTERTHGSWQESVLKDRDDAQKREREVMALYLEANNTIASLQIRNAMLTEGKERSERELNRIRLLLMERAPELRPLLTSEFGRLGGKE